MNVYDIPIRPGQIWGDAGDLRELTVRRVEERYAYCLDNNGRRTRIQLIRMHPPNYFLKKESPARYVDVPSKSHPKEIHHVWTGDKFSPAHCTCENFRWATRQAGEPYHCKHLKFVLFDEEIS